MLERVCHWCGRTVPENEWCAHCEAGFSDRSAPEEMTADEREREMISLQWAEVPFGLIHERISQLVGRPVWTHELGLNWKGLVKEARRETPPATITEILDLIPPEKRIVVSTGD